MIYPNIVRMIFMIRHVTTWDHDLLTQCEIHHDLCTWRAWTAWCRGRQPRWWVWKLASSKPSRAPEILQHSTLVRCRRRLLGEERRMGCWGKSRFRCTTPWKKTHTSSHHRPSEEFATRNTRSLEGSTVQHDFADREKIHYISIPKEKI